MSDPATLYASGEEVISRVIETDRDGTTEFTSQQEFENFYAIRRTVAEIEQRDFKRVRQ